MLDLSKKIAELAKRAGVKCDRLDMDITLSVAMNDAQRADLAAMIEFLESGHASPVNILGNVLHDLNGLKAVYQGTPKGVCFSPRSTGYAKKAG